jgi:hypothetical protein
MVDVAEIMRRLANENGTAAMDLTINVDCSNVCFVVGKSVQALASFLMKWTNVGFHDVPKGDGKQRPISKQATNKHRAERERIVSNPLSLEMSCIFFANICTVVTIIVSKFWKPLIRRRKSSNQPNQWL